MAYEGKGKDWAYRERYKIKMEATLTENLLCQRENTSKTTESLEHVTKYWPLQKVLFFKSVSNFVQIKTSRVSFIFFFNYSALD